MNRYYLKDQAQSTGEHEVYQEESSFFPENTTYLGRYDNCADVIDQAKAYYDIVDG